MKVLNNKEQNELIRKFIELNSLIVNSNIDLKAFELLAHIIFSALDTKHINKVKNELKNEQQRENKKITKV